MGTWGTGLFQNDIADDVKTTYISKLKIGKTDEAALEETIHENSDYLNDPEDSIDFWFALASLMYDCGRLNDDVRSKAVALLDSESDKGRWTEKEYIKRICELEKLRIKLDSAIPPRKKIAVTKRFVSGWKKNDIYFAKVKDICDSDKDGYFVFCVCDTVGFDVRIDGLGDILPVTYLKYSQDILEDIREADKLPFIMRCVNRSDYRFLWLYSGFSRIKSKFVYAGNYEFVRPDDKNTITFDDKLHIMEYWNNISSYL